MNSRVTVIIEDGCGEVFVCRGMHSFLTHKLFPGIDYAIGGQNARDCRHAASHAQP